MVVEKREEGRTMPTADHNERREDRDDVRPKLECRHATRVQLSLCQYIWWD